MHDGILLERRKFLQLGLMAGGVAALHVALPQASAAQLRTITLEECLALSPLEMAKRSEIVMQSWDFLRQAVSEIRNDSLRQAVFQILNNPAPTFTEALSSEKDRKEVYAQLQTQGAVDQIAFDQFLAPVDDPRKSPWPFLAGPGSGYQSHHAYPGGLVTHTALNTKVSLSLWEHYKTVYGFHLDRDVVIASQVLHDLHKPWVFQWQPNGESRTERKLAGTGEHHVYSIAESLHRGLPVEVCVAQACAHNHPGFPKDEEAPVRWLKAAATLTGKDPVKTGLLDSDGRTLPVPRRMENFVCHLGDHDWVLTVPAAKWVIEEMKQIAVKDYGMSEADLKGSRFNQLRNYVFSQASIMGLYHVLSTRGAEALSHTVQSVVVRS
ncbi:hypothetical protein SAMN02746041_01798 [Desulfacinum hydrothermale DSM 13146]|uniref:Uncharacterized protein n=1 Tax=Desulfacinum hydrothermale DSM 13146 TaxID=1121390 RepID=A0A1W1XI36_9BACT|nr:metal-dependent phosphohydrolase [Desulfacinum hydrothermale]SMC23666.1 hypothetical protein SAMN02746041_01798 [Desulfacinum hydrothermale DSM 13146]